MDYYDDYWEEASDASSPGLQRKPKPSWLVWLSDYLIIIVAFIVVINFPIYLLVIRGSDTGYIAFREPLSPHEQEEQLAHLGWPKYSGVDFTGTERAALAFTREGNGVINGGAGFLKVSFAPAAGELHGALYVIDGGEKVRLLADDHDRNSLSALYKREWRKEEEFILFVRFSGTYQGQPVVPFDYYSTNQLTCVITPTDERTAEIAFAAVPPGVAPRNDAPWTKVTVELLERPDLDLLPR